jgi:hypothetical protein
MTLACEFWSHDVHRERRFFNMKSIIFAELAGKVRRDKEGEYWAIEDIVTHFCPETRTLESIGRLLVPDVITRYCYCSPGMAIDHQLQQNHETSVCRAINTKDVPKLVAHLPGKRAAEFMSEIQDHYVRDEQQVKHPEGKHSAWAAIRQMSVQAWRRVKMSPRSLADAIRSIG